METVLVVGSPRYAGRKEVAAAIDALPDETIVTGMNDAFGRLVASCVAGRQVSGLISHLITPAAFTPTAWQEAADHLVAACGRAIIFTTGQQDGHALSFMMKLRRAGKPADIVSGAGINDSVAAHERNVRKERFEAAEFRGVRQVWRESCEAESPIEVDNRLEYHRHDLLNPERDIERAGWTLNEGLDPHAQLHLVKVGSVGHHFIDGKLQVIATPEIIRWERPVGYRDPFADEDELVNLEDFTTDECDIIDDACIIGYGPKVQWRITNGVPLSRDLYTEMEAAVLAWRGRVAA